MIGGLGGWSQDIEKDLSSTAVVFKLSSSDLVIYKKRLHALIGRSMQNNVIYPSVALFMAAAPASSSLVYPQSTARRSLLPSPTRHKHTESSSVRKVIPVNRGFSNLEPQRSGTPSWSSCCCSCTLWRTAARMMSDAGYTKDVVNPSLKTDVSVRMVQLVRTQCTAEQWGEWLTVPVERAAAAGDKELTEELVRAGASGDPIYEAIRAGQHDVVRHLRQEPEHHHLELALEVGDEAMVSLLLELGADADPADHWQYGKLYFTPIHLAAKAGQAGIVGLLMDAGADADRPADKDETTWEERCNEECNIVQTECALHFGAIGGHVGVIKEIARREPSIVNSVAESTGYTALHYAAKHSQIGAIDALVQAGADVNAQGGVGSGTALHVAVSSPDCEATLLALLQNGAKIDPIRRRNETPLDLAVKAGNVCAVKVFSSAGADVSKHVFFASAERSSSDKMLRALLGRGGDVNTKRASDGNTPLHLATGGILLWNVEILSEADADETAVNHRGETPFDVIGRHADGWSAMFRSEDDEDDIRAMLVNAPRDRADRAWSRRRFFVLCRAFPERVRLQRAQSRGDRSNSACSAAPSGSDDPSISREKKNRVATADGRGCAEGWLAGAAVHEDSMAFRIAMSRMMRLEADVIFRTIIEFV